MRPVPVSRRASRHDVASSDLNGPWATRNARPSAAGSLLGKMVDHRDGTVNMPKWLASYLNAAHALAWIAAAVALLPALKP